MFILVLTVIAMILALAGAIVYLVHTLSKVKGQLWATNQEASKARAQQKSAARAASEAQKRCQHLVGQLDSSIATNGQALSIARHIEVVSQQLGELLDYIAGPVTAARPGRHAQLLADNGFPPLPEAGPRELPGDTYLDHRYCNPYDGSSATISNGTVRYVQD